MRNRTQSKVAAFLITCGLILAGFFAVPLYSQTSGIAAITDQNGQTIYMNTDNSAKQAAPWGFRDAQTSPPAQIDSIVQRVSDEYQVDPQLVRTIIRVESDYDPKAVSPKGAMGLMQLIPATAERFGVENPFDARQNIEGGVTYLKHLLNMFGGNLPLSLAAYNAGENSVLKSGGIPAIPETRAYVKKITQLYDGEHTSAMAEVTLDPNAPPPIVRYVDAAGVIHFTNVE